MSSPQQDAGAAIEKQRIIGERLASEIRRQGKPFDHPAVDAYVKRVGERLASRLEDPPFSYSFEVLLTEAAAEPIPLPGGRILIPASFLLTVRDEAEFAGMLAHAIGHVALHHGMRSANEARAGGKEPVPLIFLGGWAGSHASGAQGALLPKSFVAAQRMYELDADRFGLQLAARAGFDPAGLRRYLERVPEPATAGHSPLPPRGDRLAALDDLLGSIPQAPAPRTAEFSQAQTAIRQVFDRPAPNRPPTLHR